MSRENSKLVKTIETIESFINKVEELKRSNFSKWIKKCGLYRIVFATKRGDSGSFKYPSAESVRSFVLAYRFFIQDNEKNSLRNMNRMINDLPISDSKKKKFNDLRNWFNSFLDSEYKFRIVGYGSVTHREIQMVFMYGKLAHENKRYYETYKKWTKSILEKDFMWINFCAVLYTAVRLLSYMQDLCKEIHKELLKIKTKARRCRA